METMALDGTFDVKLVLRVSHKIVAANHYYWAFGTGRLALQRPLNKLAAPNDAKHKRASHLNVMVTQPMLLNGESKERE